MDLSSWAETARPHWTDAPYIPPIKGAILATAEGLSSVACGNHTGAALWFLAAALWALEKKADGLEFGPVSRSGARSHVVWRMMLADRLRAGLQVRDGHPLI